MAKVGKKNLSESEAPTAESSLKSLKDRLTKNCKGVHVSLLSESDIADRGEWIPTPAYDLNRILSGDLNKGIPWKSFVLFVAPEGAGKSSFMTLIASEAAKNPDNTVVIIDTEGAYSSEFISRWGLDPDRVLYIYTPWIDEIKTVLAQIIDSDDKNIILVLDSIGGIEKKKIQEDALKGDPKADQGTLQKELKPLYKMLVNIAKTKNAIVLGAGHYYGNPGSYSGMDEIGGGKYLRLAADMIVCFKKSKLYASASDKTVIGNSLSVTAIKNRFYVPFSEATVEIDYQTGINKYAGLLEIAEECGIIDHVGNSYTYISNDGKENKYIGERNARKFFDKFGDELVEKINEIVQKTGYSTINKELSGMLSEENEQENNESLEEENIQIKENIN